MIKIKWASYQRAISGNQEVSHCVARVVAWAERKSTAHETRGSFVKFIKYRHNANYIQDKLYRLAVRRDMKGSLINDSYQSDTVSGSVKFKIYKSLDLQKRLTTADFSIVGETLFLFCIP
jgi:hypothetical protein